jgi:hypothetical protein
MREAILALLRCAEQLFSRVLEDVEPYSKPDRIGHMLLFRRFTDSQQEYCRSILALYEADCFQGTMPVLRALVILGFFWKEAYLSARQNFPTP